MVFDIKIFHCKSRQLKNLQNLSPKSLKPCLYQILGSSRYQFSEILCQFPLFLMIFDVKTLHRNLGNPENFSSQKPSRYHFLGQEINFKRFCESLCSSLYLPGILGFLVVRNAFSLAKETYRPVFRIEKRSFLSLKNCLIPLFPFKKSFYPSFEQFVSSISYELFIFHTT